MYTESLPTNNHGSDDIYDDVASTENEQEVSNNVLLFDIPFSSHVCSKHYIVRNAHCRSKTTVSGLCFHCFQMISCPGFLNFQLVIELNVAGLEFFFLGLYF